MGGYLLLDSVILFRPLAGADINRTNLLSLEPVLYGRRRLVDDATCGYNSRVVAIILGR